MIKLPAKVCVEDNATPLARIVFHFMGGSSEDPHGKEGLTSLTNRLILRGTETLCRAQYEDQLEQLGVNLVPTCSASSLSIGGSLHKRHAAQWFELLKGALTRPAFAHDEVERGKREMLAEFDAIFDEDASLGRYILDKALFKDTPYGRSGLGTPDSLERIQRDDLIEHHRKAYAQHRLLVGCAGDVGGDPIQGPLKELINCLPHGHTPQLPILPLKTRHTKVIIIDKPDRSQCQIFTGQLVSGARDGQMLPFQFGALTLGGNFSSRLVQKLRIERGLSYGAYAWLRTDQTVSALFTHADVAHDSVGEGLSVLLNAQDELEQEGVSDAEFEFGKRHILKGMAFGLETASMEVAQKIRLGLLGRNIKDFEKRVSMIESLEQSAVQDAMKSLSLKGKRVIVLVCTYDETTQRQLAPVIEPFEVDVIDGR
ncbi:MAG: M16 family metallopeptidase [Bradymonadia bacterium]